MARHISKGSKDREVSANTEGFTPLLGALRQRIADSRQQVLRAVDVVQVQTYWHIGRHIVEFEQGGAQRAAYGRGLLAQLGQALTAEFGRGFDASNLRHMRGFYLAFPIRDALRRELSWTHYRLLLRVDSAEARQWYVQEAATQNWSTRALERQISSQYYERLLLSQDKAAVSAEAQANLAALEDSPRAFVRDPVMLAFLGLPDTGRERDPEMHQTKKGNQWYFGMKAHIGVDAETGIVHTLVTTSANINDVTQAHALLHGEERLAFGDAGYQGVEKREENRGRRVEWEIAMRPGKRKALPDTRVGRLQEQLEQARARIRAKVEHPFKIIKNLFGMKKVSYRGLAKNTARLYTLFGLANLLTAKRRLFALNTQGAS